MRTHKYVPPLDGMNKRLFKVDGSWKEALVQKKVAYIDMNEVVRSIFSMIRPK